MLSPNPLRKSCSYANFANWWIGVKEGQYMGGMIRPDTRGKGCKCGGKYISVMTKEYRNKVPRCELCFEPPPKLLVRVNLPAIGNRDIRYDLEGARFDTLSIADSFLTTTRNKIKNRTFEPDRYLAPSKRNQLLARAYIKDYLDSKEKGRGTRRGCSPGYLDDCWKLYRNHLAPYFGDMDIRDIRYPHLVDFLDNGQGGGRQREKAYGLLKVILQEARKSLASMVLPQFPPVPQSKKTKAKLLRDDQWKVVQNLEEHKAAITLAVLYPIRPCEIRDLRWKDIDLKKRVMTIRKHMSGSVKGGSSITGRKSHFDESDPFSELELHLTSQAYDLLASLPRGIGDQHVFLTKTGKPLYESAMRKSWNVACRKAGLPHISMYCGTKHSTVNFHLNERGIPMEVLRLIAGHTDVRSTERYAIESTKSASKHLED